MGCIKDAIYLDYNATTPLLPAVRVAMVEAMAGPLNPSSLHSFGREAKSILDTARSSIAHLVGSDDDYNVVFTASGTEANNLALKGLEGYVVITTPVEHLSVLSVVGGGMIPVNNLGIIDLAALEQIVTSLQGSFLVSVQFANNETGVIQPIKSAAEIVHKYGGLIHTDATQAFGKVEFDALDLGVDLITVTAHKFGGPVGAAALVFRKSIPLKSLMQGGGQEYRFRPGTQNTIAIKGFSIAARAAADLIAQQKEVQVLRDLLEEEIKNIDPNIIIFGDRAQRLPNTTSIGMPGVANETQVIHFDLNGFAVSAGSACSSGTVSLPYVQMSMGYDEEIARTALRISLGAGNTKAEVKKFIEYWRILYNTTRKKAA